MGSSLIRAALLCSVVVFAPTQSTEAQDAGAYLAARQASVSNDYSAAATYFSEALRGDPENPVLLENGVTALAGLGDIERAAPFAERLTQISQDSQLANVVLYSNDALIGNWQGILDRLDSGQVVGPLYDGLLEAWALVGLGRMSDAIEAFDTMATSPGVDTFANYHKALALASVGDLEGAAAIFGGEGNSGVRVSRRGVLAYANILAQLERFEDAKELLDEAFPGFSDPLLDQVRTEMDAGKVPDQSLVTTAVQGVGELNFTIAGAVSGEASDSYTLIYARMAEQLDADNIDAKLLAGDLLEALENYELATLVYDEVPREHPLFHLAEMGRADALRRIDREEAAIEVLAQLGESHGHIADVHIRLGDMLRRLERFSEASSAYDRAIDMFDNPRESQWSAYFARGITHEREDRWDQAEADFRKALELRPNQPQVMNYLGYSFVEMNENLDEALDLIERAVSLQPDSGYITDSLGWVYYQLGRYEEAVDPMELAVELVPVDPIINDHLGDVYWAVGRQREAEFQWLRALSFDPEDKDAERIRRKLEVGLDVVLEEEGAAPLAVANEDG